LAPLFVVYSNEREYYTFGRFYYTSRYSKRIKESIFDIQL